jgi:Xaa-Pro aminopeptidase
MDASQFKSFLFILDKDPDLEQWHGRRLSRGDAGDISGVELIYYLSDLEEKLKDLFAPVSRLHMDFNINMATDHAIRKYMGEKIIQIPLQPRIDLLRLIKDSHELDIIKKGMQITIDAHTEAMRCTAPGITEIQLESIYSNEFRFGGAILPTYEANVSSGNNSLILHHHATHKIAEAGEMILVDCGAEYNHYTADVARTWPVSGSFTEPQKYLYNRILDINMRCIEMVQPGRKFWDIHEYAVSELVDLMIDIGIFTDEKEEIIQEKLYKPYFPHGIGHFLGMDGHDTPTINRNDVILQAGMYVTIEPGIYLPDSDPVPEKYRSIGIRIEDNIIVTPSGSENLSERLAKTVEEIEAVVGKKL